MQYSSHTFSHEQLNQVVVVGVSLFLTYWIVSWDGNSKFHRPALRHLFRKKNSTWKLSLAVKNKLRRHNTSRLPSFRKPHVNCGTSNQPACRESTPCISMISVQNCQSQLSGHLDQEAVVASHTRGAIRHKAWRDPWTKEGSLSVPLFLKPVLILKGPSAS